MSHTNATAVPPAPPNFLQCADKSNNSTPQRQKPQLEECLWSIDQPELQKACFLARICTTRKPKSCTYYNINSILQVGPTCGLTAVSMLLGGLLPPTVLLQEAKERHYTYNGEMFSAHNLFQLICDYLPIINNNNNNNDDVTIDKNSRPCKLNANDTDSRNTATTTPAQIPQQQQRRQTAVHQRPIECQMHEGRLNCAKVRDALLQGACLFVPYDPDFNHSPCLKSGHKAHWALIIGHLIADNDEFYVIARHGKAKNLAVWSLQSLSDSNANLIEFAQPKGYPDCDFLLPPGGIGGNLGLRERAIIVKGLPLEITTIS
ncbi:actin maturation protease [Musca vetustissima]|uniref:actin maturation protease n=1 Tax=Musca vetustissima TaxID=27455 RepID=UPI002AB62283|nr:actin maturation protease [Musca vetustissima]